MSEAQRSTWMNLVQLYETLGNTDESKGIWSYLALQEEEKSTS